MESVSSQMLSFNWTILAGLRCKRDYPSISTEESQEKPNKDVSVLYRIIFPTNILFTRAYESLDVCHNFIVGFKIEKEKKSLLGICRNLRFQTRLSLSSIFKKFTAKMFLTLQALESWFRILPLWSSNFTKFFPCSCWPWTTSSLLMECVLVGSNFLIHNAWIVIF